MTTPAPPVSVEGPVRPARRFDPAASIVGGVLLLLGVGSGVLWAFVTPYATVEVTAEGGGFSAPELAHLFGGVAVFALIAFALGLVCGGVAWGALRAVRGPAGLVYAMVVAAGASAVGMQVADFVVRRRFPPIDPHEPGIYHAAGSLWLTDASLGFLPAPWLLLVCAPGMAALSYFVCVAGTGDAALPGDPAEAGGIRAPGDAAPQPPAGWTYPGDPAMGWAPAGAPADTGNPGRGNPGTPASDRGEPLTGADAESRTRP